ncbi:MAG TPA: circularly permuted type 2 ATP-grasp protein [Acidimicrobiales bacterium]|nr:circularly permuted type 2 ATP-grasp protein [Acidimicrobiales bacterium]
MGDLFDAYMPGVAWDEMFQSPGETRPHYGPIFDVLSTLTDRDYTDRCKARDRSFRDQGITFSLSGEQRPFPLDLVPRVIPADEWEIIEAGVAQRVRALEAFLDDVYGEGRVFADRIIPRRLVQSSTHYQREAFGIVPPNRVRIHVAGIDLIRDIDGRYRVLEDNVRTPSGISYVIENRRAMTHVFPELFSSLRVRPVADYPSHLLEALRAGAPAGRSDPTVVVLTPGVHNSAYFEHSFLARQMGVALVEGRDLVCRNGVVRMRTTSGEQRVDVVYRRVDDDFLDPLQFRANSMLGCPGILNAAREGNVTIANAVGNGVADDKAIYPHVPALMRYYLDEEPILANVDTLHLEDPDHRAHVLAHLDEMVVKPVDGSGGYGLVIGPQASDEQLAALRVEIAENPRGWIAQPVVQLSTSPTHTGTAFGPRHVDLRPFAVNDGHKVWVVPGGLTRVALPEGSLVVNSSQGGGSKDTWVLTPSGEARERLVASGYRQPGAVWARPPDAGPAGNVESQGQQQQQQQQHDQPASVVEVKDQC